jgi:hypothetical protein
MDLGKDPASEIPEASMPRPDGGPLIVGVKLTQFFRTSVELWSKRLARVPSGSAKEILV